MSLILHAIHIAMQLLLIFIGTVNNSAEMNDVPSTYMRLTYIPIDMFIYNYIAMCVYVFTIDKSMDLSLSSDTVESMLSSPSGM